ncbi:hypothetical protein AMTR_s00060p00055410 [Amborella trichopoda]|uniref:Uncharacterized protein n=1 Tax=Amborella trichopoda TaxID=13333 RepID=W1NJ62_AMBTC|nr:hypothetical protein AMTR_s00060p00055410 [Amborella trichopoda]
MIHRRLLPFCLAAKKARHCRRLLPFAFWHSAVVWDAESDSNDLHTSEDFSAVRNASQLQVVPLSVSHAVAAVDPELLTDLAPGSLKELVPVVDDLQTLSLAAVSLEPEHSVALVPGSLEEFEPFESVADELKNHLDADPFPTPTSYVDNVAEHSAAFGPGTLEESEPEEFEPFESIAYEL